MFGAAFILLLATPAESPPVEIDDMTAQQIIDAVLAGIAEGVPISMTQPVPVGNTPQTVGDCLNAARADGFGKWVKVGNIVTLYAPDGTTAVRTFTLDDVTSPTSRT